MVSEKRLIVKIDYNLIIIKDNNFFELKSYEKVFDREVLVDLRDNKKKIIYSSDKLFKVEIEENTKFFDIKGNEIKDIFIIRIEDKNNLFGEKLESNIIYGLLPTDIYTSKSIKICFDNLFIKGKDIDKLKISWFFKEDKKWGYLNGNKEEFCFGTNVNFTTYYGLTYKEEPISGIPNSIKDLEEETFFNNLQQNNLNNQVNNNLANTNNINYQIYPINNDVLNLFNQINNEMNGPYKLNLNPNCVLGGKQVYCFVGYVPNCHIVAVNCDLNKLNTMSDKELNLLLRHEITHSIQQKNNGCSYKNNIEWGAEYYSGTSYYRCPINGKIYTARQIGEEMKKKGCSEEDILNAAFCVPGALDILKSNNCLLANNGNSILDTQDCVP
ncbi:MAG: hypothetical protein QXM96_04115 [Candidatus Woesearchaeota archaeon]